MSIEIVLIQKDTRFSIDQKIGNDSRNHGSLAKINKTRKNPRREKHFSEEKPEWLKKLIERLEDKRDEVKVEEIEAPLYIQKILNVTFVVLGLALFFGLIAAILFSVGM